MIVLSFAVPLLLGLCIVALALREDSSTGFLERLCLSYPLGAAALTLQMFLLGLARVPLEFGIVLGLVVSEIVALAAYLYLRRIPLAPKLSFPFIGELRDPERSYPARAALLVLAAWAAAKIASVFLESSLRPIFGWDSWGNWSISAKVFFYSKGFLLDEAPEYFFGNGVGRRVLGYPLHNPLMQVWTSLCLGGFDEVLAKIWVAGYLACGALYLYLSARREAGTLIGLSILVIFVGSPLMSFHAVDAYSDLPLGILLLLASGAFVKALRGNGAHRALLGMLSAAALFTKDEALFFVGPMMAAAVLSAAYRTTPGSRGRSLLALLLPLAAVAPWFVFKAIFVPTLGGDWSVTTLGFYPENILQALSASLHLRSFGIVPAAVPILLVLGRRPDGAVLRLAAVAGLYYLFFLFLYGFIPHFDMHFKKGMIYDRNILTLYPSLCLLAALLTRGVAPDSWKPEPAREEAVRGNSR